MRTNINSGKQIPLQKRQAQGTSLSAIQYLQNKNSIPGRLKPITHRYIDPLTGRYHSKKPKPIHKSFLEMLNQKKQQKKISLTI